MITTHTDPQQTVSNETAGVRYLSSVSPEVNSLTESTEIEVEAGGEMISFDGENNDNGPPQSDGEDMIDGGMISSDGEDNDNGPPQSHEEDVIDGGMIYSDVENNDNGPPQSHEEDKIDEGMISSDDEYNSSTALDLDLTGGPSNQNNLPANVPCLNDVGIQLDNLFPPSRPVNTDGGIHSSGERNCDIATSVGLDLNDGPSNQNNLSANVPLNDVGIGNQVDNLFPQSRPVNTDVGIHSSYITSVGLNLDGEPSNLFSLAVSVPSNDTGIQQSNLITQFGRVNAGGIISSNKEKLDTSTSAGLDLNGGASIRKSLSASGPSYTIGVQPGNLFTQIEPVNNVSGVNMNSSGPLNLSFAGTSIVLNVKPGNSESKNVEYSHLLEDGGDDLLSDLVSFMDPPGFF
ncbi:uncharacterized protein DDB_G0290685-like [Frankliniella occidentalis]|uniref:Uncharacterized protein DDB_G0290685-like n=1 Tax=Frankliniella occidentalis TaxID=133901 RepID=A0A9C6U2L3_FRAOC|nr:uncharacterized protein DDB_G0290685-like [Frankliniella occidentalis]